MRVDLVALISAMAAALQRLDAHLQRQTLTQVRGFDGWYDHDSITELATLLAQQVQAAQRQTAAVTDAYLARVATEITGSRVRPLGVIDVGDLRGGTPLDSVYGRLANAYRYQASEGKTDVEARQIVEQRAESMAATDTSLAMRAQARQFMVVHHVDGYRRIIHPELSQHGTCGLCVAASDQTYHRGDLMPLHDRCKCTVLPIINGKDPGQSINRADLERLYAAAGGTAGEKLHNVRVQTQHHGELGPVLTKHGHHFRDPADVAAA